MPAERLATLDHLRAWLGSGGSTTPDKLLEDLLDRASTFIRTELGLQQFASRSYSVIVDGRGGVRWPFRHRPVTAVTSLSIGGVAIAASAWSAGAADSGYFFEPWDGSDPPLHQGLSLTGLQYTPGAQNIAITYVAGWRKSETQAIAVANANTLTTFDHWLADHGVTRVSDSVALTKITSGTPTTGQYKLGDKPGQYIFATADAAVEVSIAYSYAPADIVQACVEIAGWSYRGKDHIGHVSKQIGGQETVTYSLASIPPLAARTLINYKPLALFW